MTLSDTVGLRAACLQIALHEAQRGSSQTDIGARAAELAEWAMAFQRTRPPTIQRGLAEELGRMQEDNQAASEHGQVGRTIRVDRAYHMQTNDGVEWWVFRSGSGANQHLGSIPQFHGRARLVGSGKMTLQTKHLL